MGDIPDTRVRKEEGRLFHTAYLPAKTTEKYNSAPGRDNNFVS